MPGEEGELNKEITEMKQYGFGVDIGGTTCKIGLFETNGTLLDKWEIPTRTENEGSSILPDVAASIEAKLSEKQISKADVQGIGIGVPGPVTSEGVVKKCINLGWGVFNVAEAMEKLCGVPVKAGNDANVAALGEMWKGAAAGHKSGVMVTLGTGVGGGIIIDGKIITGANGAGGEIGHIHVEDAVDWNCGCGNQGCLEQLASANGMVTLAKWMIRQGADTKGTTLQPETMTAKDIWDAVKADDAFAKDVAERFGKYLGLALANVASTVDPEVFVIGGGVSKAGPVILDYIKKYYLKYTFRGCRGAKFVLATLGNDAGMYGSAKLVLEQ